MALTKEEINKYKEALKKEREDIEEELKDQEEDLNFSSGGDLEVETDETEAFSNYIDIKRRMEARLDNIENALERIEESKYGKCKKCGKGISKEVLDANPASTLCRECKKKI